MEYRQRLRLLCEDFALMDRPRTFWEITGMWHRGLEGTMWEKHLEHFRYETPKGTWWSDLEVIYCLERLANYVKGWGIDDAIIFVMKNEPKSREIDFQTWRSIGPRFVYAEDFRKNHEDWERIDAQHHFFWYATYRGLIPPPEEFPNTVVEDTEEEEEEEDEEAEWNEELTPALEDINLNMDVEESNEGKNPDDYDPEEGPDPYEEEKEEEEEEEEEEDPSEDPEWERNERERFMNESIKWDTPYERHYTNPDLGPMPELTLEVNPSAGTVMMIEGSSSDVEEIPNSPNKKEKENEKGDKTKFKELKEKVCPKIDNNQTTEASTSGGSTKFFRRYFKTYSRRNKSL